MKTCRRKLHQYANNLPQCPECNRANVKLWKKKNKEKHTAFSKTWKEANPDKKKDWVLRDKFGISLEEYRKMLATQSGKCAICHQPEMATLKKSGKVKELSVDHCHSTGKVRGLLCYRCNTALGLLREDTGIALNLINYIDCYSSFPEIR
jgi:hypothetical protein